MHRWEVFLGVVSALGKKGTNSISLWICEVGSASCELSNSLLPSSIWSYSKQIYWQQHTHSSSCITPVSSSYCYDTWNKLEHILLEVLFAGWSSVHWVIRVFVSCLLWRSSVHFWLLLVFSFQCEISNYITNVLNLELNRAEAIDLCGLPVKKMDKGIQPIDPVFRERTSHMLTESTVFFPFWMLQLDQFYCQNHRLCVCTRNDKKHNVFLLFPTVGRIKEIALFAISSWSVVISRDQSSV